MKTPTPISDSGRLTRILTLLLGAVFAVHEAQAETHDQLLELLGCVGSPISPLIRASDGALYGITGGVIFKVNGSPGDYTEVLRYDVGSLGAYLDAYTLRGALVEGSD